MGIKTTIDSRGVVSERVAGSDQVIVKISARKQIQKFAADTGGAITKPVAVFEAATTAVTGTLPPVTDANLGLEFTVINANVANSLVVSASTGNPIDSGALEFVVAEEAAVLMAVSSALDGYSWIVIGTKA